MRQAGGKGLWLGKDRGGLSVLVERTGSGNTPVPGPGGVWGEVEGKVPGQGAGRTVVPAHTSPIPIQKRGQP